MPHRLTRKELRIIEETKREGENLPQPNDGRNRTRPLRAALVLIILFCLLAFLMKIFVTALS